MARSAPLDPFLQHVGQAIGTLRRRRGWSQELLGQRLGMTAKAVAKFESGTFDLRLKTIRKLADALEVTPGQLLDAELDGTDGRSVRKPGLLAALKAAGWHKASAGSAGTIAVLDVHARAGRASDAREPKIAGWVVPPESRHLTEDGLFLAQVHGDSMEPELAEGTWCLFSRGIASSGLVGRTVLVRQLDASGLPSWIVKRVQALRATESGEMQLELTSRNRQYPPIALQLDQQGEVAIVAVLREVVCAPPSVRSRPLPSNNSQGTN